MKKLCFLSLLSLQYSFAQSLSVEQIMQDPKTWISTSPSGIFWGEDSKTVYFNWNPEANKGDSLYKITLTSRKPQKVNWQERRSLPNPNGGSYNKTFTQRVYTKNGDIFWQDCISQQIRQLTNTTDTEGNVGFSGDEKQVIFTRSNNLFGLTLESGSITQYTNFLAGSKKAEAKPNEQEKWLKADQLALFEVLKERADKKKEEERIQKANAPKRPKDIYLEDKLVDNQALSPNGRFVTYRLTKTSQGKATIVPNYVTESGFTEDIPARNKVGYALSSAEFFVYDSVKDTVLAVSTKDLTGITDTPDYTPKSSLADTSKKATKAKPEARKVICSNLLWSENGQFVVLTVRSFDNKDRWIVSLDPQTAKLKVLDRQRDEAWVGGPGTSFNPTLGFLSDNQTLYYQSEADGYSHLYTVNVATGEKKQLTKGKFEVQGVQISRDKNWFYLQTNEAHPGEQHYYKMAVAGGDRTRLTSMVGSNQAVLSPDEKQIAYLYSSTNKPWELYLQENSPTAKPEVITQSVTAAFNAYAWREPQVISFKASDGAEVYARLYKPKKANKAAVVFVHGAGYLQNAHKWWSSYFREYQFHNLLVERGYTVLDIDYRASAGYGRDWRTGIYRFMGGKDLSDNVDGAKYLVEKHGIDPKRIGIYGGSYGGFITLMAMFTTPEVFKAGAALRPVTDWAAYNHGYTSNILNEPFTDSLAYRKSSPIYHAAGLKGKLLICHGLVDVNVHIQDSFRLAQRLMELKKENWELAVYPVEDHGFVEPTSWMDEYKRILKLFEGL